MKYSSTVRPSRKLEVMGVSMTSAEGLAIKPRLQVVQQDDGIRETETQIGVINELLNALLLEQPVHEREFLGQMRIENDAANSGLDELALHLHRLGVRHVLVVVGGSEVNDFTGIAQANRRKQLDLAGFQREDDILGGTENAAFTLGAGLVLGQVVDAQHHVL